MPYRRLGPCSSAATVAVGWLGIALIVTSQGCSARPQPPAATAPNDEPIPPEAALTPEEAAKALKAQPRIKQKP